MIVVDVNIVVYRHSSGPFTPQSQELLGLDGDWRTSRLWRYEFANVMTTMVRGGILDLPQAVGLMAAAEEEMEEREDDVPQADAIRLARRYGISAYDAQYVLLAEILGVKCVTADAPLVRKAPSTCVLLSNLDELR